VIVETVGVGQSEITVRSMVDVFLLLLITGAGDELQGLKKGIMELADAVLINKADGENRPRADALRIDYARALHFLPPATQGWTTRVGICSALTGEGVPDVWNMVMDFRTVTQDSGVFENRRRTQLLDWVHAMVDERLRVTFLKHARVRQLLPSIEQDVLQGRKTAVVAVQELLQAFDQRHHGTHE
jgi:LAO/AO transport system kinase